jgi:hypothetical protein
MGIIKIVGYLAYTNRTQRWGEQETEIRRAGGREAVEDEDE